MQDTLKILLQLRAEGTIGRFAIGGAIAASFYVEAVATEDLDVFVEDIRGQTTVNSAS